MQLKITEILLIISTASFVAVILEMNRLGKNICDKVHKPNIIYISNALISATCGCVLSLAMMLITNNLIIWVLVSMLGAYMGTKSFRFALKILLLSLDFLKKTDFNKVIDGLDGEIDDNAEDKSDRKKKKTTKKG